MIRYLRNSEIDKEKWDACIDASPNGLPYAKYWYLQITAEGNWDALVEDDYISVFPLPFKNRIIYKLIYQPFFTQQLGLFSQSGNIEQKLHYFIQAIPPAFRKVQLHLNTQNILTSSFVQVKHRVTHHIDLSKPYETLAEAYSINTKRNLKKAQKNDLRIDTHVTPAELIAFRKQNVPDALQGKQSASDQMRLQKLQEKAISINAGKMYAVYALSGETLAMLFLLESNGYLIYLTAISSEAGKKAFAMFYLVDHIIQTHAGEKCILDFEGSMIAGIAQFFRGFGAHAVEFPVIIK
ncbi:MAG: hypothetical protein R2794_10550 [Chitinophagales bacterium]